MMSFGRTTGHVQDRRGSMISIICRKSRHPVTPTKRTDTVATTQPQTVERHETGVQAVSLMTIPFVIEGNQVAWPSLHTLPGVFSRDALPSLSIM